MAKFKVILVFILYSVIHAIAASSQGPQPVDKWFQNLKKNKLVPKTDIIQVYVQDVLGGPGQTVYEIARSNISSETSFGVFGQLFMSDDLLTAGPDPSSQPLGRAQGLVGFSDLNELVVYVSVNFYFRGGPYDGSTISVFGRNPIQNAAMMVVRSLCLDGIPYRMLLENYLLLEVQEFFGWREALLYPPLIWISMQLVMLFSNIPYMLLFLEQGNDSSLSRCFDRIHVYVQDVLGGPGQTVHEIARSNITSTSPTSFGQLFMSDDLITAEPDPGSQAIGRAQGLVGFADLNEFALYLSVNFFFKGGPYNGSTISVLGRNPILDATRELSIVGGTGVFRLARGVAVASTHMNYNASGYGILKYTFYVFLESGNDYSVV